MNRSTATVRVGAALALLGACLAGIGVGTALATMGTTNTTAAATTGVATTVDATPVVTTGNVDLTRHSTTLIDGVPGDRGSVIVACPEGTVIGGGFSHVSSGLRVTASRPDGIRAWQVDWTQTSTDDTALYAYAVCLTTS